MAVEGFFVTSGLADLELALGSQRPAVHVVGELEVERDVAQLHAAYAAQGLAVWAINTATERADFEKWAKDNAAALGYSVAWDPAGKAFMEAASNVNFGIGMYPAFVVVDAGGEFRGGLIGMGLAGLAAPSD